MVLQMKNPHKNLNELIYLINLANACRCPENMLLIPVILFTTKHIVLDGPFYSKVNTNDMWAMITECPSVIIACGLHQWLLYTFYV